MTLILQQFINQNVKVIIFEGDVVDSSTTPNEVITKKVDQEVYQQGMTKDVGVKGKGVDEFKKAVKVLFNRPNVNKLVHVKPLYLHVKIEGEEIGKVLVDNGTAMNKLPLSMLKLIGKTL